MNTVSAPSSELLLQHLASIQFTVAATGFIVDAEVNNPSSTVQPDDLIGTSISEIVTEESIGALNAKLNEARRNKGTAVKVRRDGQSSQHKPRSTTVLAVLSEQQRRRANSGA